jgi:DNA-binding NtrC family response regulator
MVESRKTVLVVDDDRAVLVLSEIFLSRNGYTVLTATNYQSAIEQLKENAENLDLLVTDTTYELVDGGPKVQDSGVRLSAHVHEKFPEMFPVIGMSAADEVQMRALYDKGGHIEEYIGKPFKSGADFVQICNDTIANHYNKQTQPLNLEELTKN